MADRMLFLGWGTVVRGREERALECFNESVGLYGRMQQEGRIESFDVGLLTPNGGDLDGFIALRGSAAQMAAVHEDDEFRRLQVAVELIVDDLRIVDGFCGDGIAEEMARYTEAVGKVPQSA